MKALVCVKRVIDYNVKPRVKSDGTGVDLANVKMSMNPFDEIAVEEALRLREKGVATEVIAVSVGPEKAQETLRTALAMGADRAVLVQVDDGVEVEPLAVAKIIKGVAGEEEPGLIITGKQAIDDDSNQVGQMVAALMGEGRIDLAGDVLPAGEVLERLGRVPLVLAPKEGLALINGTQASTAIALDALFLGERVFAAAIHAGATRCSDSTAIASAWLGACRTRASTPAPSAPPGRYTSSSAGPTTRTSRRRSDASRLT